MSRWAAIGKEPPTGAEHEGLPHMYPITRHPEAAAATEQIGKFLIRDSSQAVERTAALLGSGHRSERRQPCTAIRIRRHSSDRLPPWHSGRPRIQTEPWRV
jgi:hypothetical protein